LSASATENGTGVQTVQKATPRPTISTIFTGILAAFNIFLAITPQFEIIYLALVGVVGGASVVMDYMKLPWARSLSMGAALISITAAVSAITSALILYPLIRTDVVQFLSMNLVSLLYLSVSIVSLATSLRRE